MFESIFLPFIIEPLFNLLILIYSLIPGHDFGVAVIVLTFVIRIVLWPLLSKQIHQQKTMKELAPEVAKIKKQTKGNREKEAQMLMELYKEKGISPFGPFKPLLMQFPILLGLFSVLRRVFQEGEIAERTYTFITDNSSFAANLVANPEPLHPYFLNIIDLSTPQVSMAIFAAAAQFFQAKMMAPDMPKNDAQKAASKAIYILPVITFVFSLSFPGALALYWGMGSLISLFQQKLIMDHDIHSLNQFAKRSANKAQKTNSQRKQIKSKVKE